MKAIVLAGGFGKRLHPLTKLTPKPLLPIVGKPVMGHIIDSLYAAGVREVIVSVNKAHEKELRNFLGDGTKFGVKASYVVEDSTSDEAKPGAVGALGQLAQKLDKDSNYIVAGADNFAPEFDFARLAEAHKAGGAVVTLALNKVTDKGELKHLGVVKTDENGKVVAFQEKPNVDEAISDLANTAFFVAKPEFFHRVTAKYVAGQKAAGRKPDNLGDIFKKMVEWNDHVHSYTFDGLWIDVGNPNAYLRATKYLVKSVCNGNGPVVDWSASFDADAAVVGTSIIEKNVKVGQGSLVKEGCHIMENVKIGKGCIVEGSVIFPNAEVGDNARLHNCIVTENSIVPKGHISEKPKVLHNGSTAPQPEGLQ